MGELLLELRGDGFPGDEVERATSHLKDALVAALREAGLPARQSATGCSGRRMMVLLRGMPKVREGDESRRLVRVRRAIEETLPEVPWRQVVDFGDGFRWGAPIHGILALLDGEIVPARAFGLQAGGASVGPLSRGARRLLPRDGDEFARLLHREGIEVRLPSRRARLVRTAKELAEKVGALPVAGGEVETWAAVYETPSVLLCRLPDLVADLPRELVAACLGARQQAVVLTRQEPAGEADGSLLSAGHFLAVVDRVDLTPEQEERIRRGNERAARAHLEDARFHYERDLKTPLAQRIRLLSDELDAREAEYGRRRQRLEGLCTFLAAELGATASLDALHQAAGLLYADRSTETVREFSGLAGVVGGLLAREEGYPATVWQSVYDSGRRGEPPRGLPGQVLLIADRVDRLVSLLVERQGLPPAGGRRRSDGPRSTSVADDEIQGLAGEVIDVARHAELGLDPVLALAHAVRQRRLADATGELLREASVLFDGALRQRLAAAGASQSESDAVLLASGGSSIPLVFGRVLGLRTLREDGRLALLGTSARRMRDLLLESREADLDPEALEAPEEVELHRIWVGYEPKISDALIEGDFGRWLDAMSVLDEVVQRFLAGVLVHDANDTLQRNRLALLQEMQRVYAGPVRCAELGP